MKGIFLSGVALVYLYLAVISGGWCLGQWLACITGAEGGLEVRTLRSAALRSSLFLPASLYCQKQSQQRPIYSSTNDVPRDALVRTTLLERVTAT